jgi:hypothetical protein
MGSTVEVHFALAHHFFKRRNKHIFSTLLRELKLLTGPDTLPSRPFKRLRVGAAHGSGNTN